MPSVHISFEMNEMQLDSTIDTLHEAIADHNRSCKGPSRCSELSNIEYLFTAFTDARAKLHEAKDKVFVIHAVV